MLDVPLAHSRESNRIRTQQRLLAADRDLRKTCARGRRSLGVPVATSFSPAAGWQPDPPSSRLPPYRAWQAGPWCPRLKLLDQGMGSVRDSTSSPAVSSSRKHRRLVSNSRANARRRCCPTDRLSYVLRRFSAGTTVQRIGAWRHP